MSGVTAIAGTRAGPAGVVVVPAAAGPAGFTVDRRDGTRVSLSGAQLARLLETCLEPHPDGLPGVQLALGWPPAPRACARLAKQVQRLADALDAPVWVPERGGVATVLPGCADLAAVGTGGDPMAWRAYPPRQVDGWCAGLESDPDGRLVPGGGIAVTAFRGGPLVSVPKDRLTGAGERYERVVAGPTRLPLDLGLLSDGRLGVCVDSGELIAVGPRQLRRMLQHGGWAGQDLLMLATPGPGQWAVTAGHAAWLAHALRVEIWLLGPGVTWSVDTQGQIRSSAHPEAAGWCRASADAEVVGAGPDV